MIKDVNPIIKLTIILTLLLLIGTVSVLGSGGDEDITVFGKGFLYIAQVLGVIIVFVIPAVLFAILLTSEKFNYLQLHIKPHLLTLILGALVFVFGLPLISYLGELNSKMILPESFAGIETWMKATEKQAAIVTEYLMSGTSIKSLVVNLFVIAFMAALSEELFFRGVLQRTLLEVVRNKHIAIWITAILFSAFHMQFYGFIPRMIMGAVLGYLFVWSRSLWVPIFAHFINNALAVFVAHLIKKGSISADVEKMGTVPGEMILPVTISTALVIGILFAIYKLEANRIPKD